MKTGHCSHTFYSIQTNKNRVVCFFRRRFPCCHSCTAELTDARFLFTLQPEKAFLIISVREPPLQTSVAFSQRGGGRSLRWVLAVAGCGVEGDHARVLRACFAHAHTYSASRGSGGRVSGGRNASHPPPPPPTPLLQRGCQLSHETCSVTD